MDHLFISETFVKPRAAFHPPSQQGVNVGFQSNGKGALRLGNERKLDGLVMARPRTQRCARGQ